MNDSNEMDKILKEIKKKKKEEKKLQKKKTKESQQNSESQKTETQENADNTPKTSQDVKRQRYIQNEVEKLAEKAARRTAVRRIVVVAILVLLTAICSTYGILKFATNNAVTVKVQNNNTNYSITLCENPNFTTANAELRGEAPKQLKEFTYDRFETITKLSDISELDVNQVGSHNTKYYMAYTFYVKNNGNLAVDYEVKVDIELSTKGIENALRVIFFDNNDPTVYGLTKANGELPNVYNSKADSANDEAFAKAEPFISDKAVLNKQKEKFEVDEVHQYTLVTYIEGNDTTPENENGVAKLAVNLTIIDTYE